MYVTRHEPQSSIRRFHDEVNRLFNPDSLPGYEAAEPRARAAAPASGWIPAVDIREEAERFVIAADVPGVEAGEIEITMEDGVLSIRGERKSAGADETGEFRRTERSRGAFHRRFSLPDTADAGAISAHSSHGVLEVTIPKKKAVPPRRIPVA